MKRFRPCQSRTRHSAWTCEQEAGCRHRPRAGGGWGSVADHDDVGSAVTMPNEIGESGATEDSFGYGSFDHNFRP